MSYSKFYGSLIWMVFLFFGLLSCGDRKTKTRATVPASQIQRTIKSLNCAKGSLKISKKGAVAGPSVNTVQPGEALSINGNSTNRVQNPCLNNSGFNFHCEGMAQNESSFICQSGYITLTNPGAPTPSYQTLPSHSQIPGTSHYSRPPTNRINIHNAEIKTWGDYKKFLVALIFSHPTSPQHICRFSYGCY